MAAEGENISQKMATQETTKQDTIKADSDEQKKINSAGTVASNCVDNVILNGANQKQQQQRKKIGSSMKQQQQISTTSNKSTNSNAASALEPSQKKSAKNQVVLENSNVVPPPQSQKEEKVINKSAQESDSLAAAMDNSTMTADDNNQPSSSSSPSQAKDSVRSIATSTEGSTTKKNNNNGISNLLPSLTDPNAVRFKFIFANHDGFNVLIDCKLTDTVGEVKGALLSVWPKKLPEISESDRIRLICMGRGFLMPDTRNLNDCQVPVFKTHATPINVSIKPESYALSPEKNSKNKDSSSNNPSNNDGSGRINGSALMGGSNGNGTTRQGCACVIL